MRRARHLTGALSILLASSLFFPVTGVAHAATTTEAFAPTAAVRVPPSVPVKNVGPAAGTTLEQARRAAGTTTGQPYPFNSPQNFEIPNPEAYKHVPEIRSPRCVLDKKHPDPIVLVHGTWANAQKWQDLAKVLIAEGHCVFAMNYGFDARHPFYNNPEDGVFATSDSYSSAIELDRYVSSVLKRTGARKVTLIGHSQAGFIFRLWLHDFRGYLRTHRSITLGGTNHGTDMMGIATAIPLWSSPVLATGVSLLISDAAAGQLIGSPTQRYIDSLPETMPGVSYTVITTEDDRTSTPYNAGFLHKVAPGASVDNVVMQKACRVDHTIDHNQLTTDPLVFEVILATLRGMPPACAYQG